jgi:AraC-like DNA-binding protein
MTETLGRDLPGRLERSCKGASLNAAECDEIRIGSSAPGIERLAARLHGRAFAPHRHDTYAIGITVTGVQTFRYRGVGRYCLRGQCHMLHPDELHDGAAGTDDGFGYHILYVDPSLVQQALGGRPLPFVSEPVIEAKRLPVGLRAAIMAIDNEIDALAAVEVAVALADVLASLAAVAPSRPGRLDMPALARVRGVLVAIPEKPHALAPLEQLAGLDRWALARQFRCAFGVSPARFRTMRQLDRVRREVRAGVGLAEASLAAGFADQSHMTRHFKRAYGLTPARWAALATMAQTIGDSVFARRECGMFAGISPAGRST